MTEAVLARPARVFSVSFALVFLSMASWSLATPMYASPDEPAHVIRAVSIDRGQLIGRPVGGPSSPFTKVTVPASIADGSRYPACFAFEPSVAASCARPLKSSTISVVNETSAGRYPPLYYAIVGLPSLATSSSTGVYLMRFGSAALAALFVGLAMMSVCAWSKFRFTFVGILCALTPMALFLGGVVNPNGVEISAAICLWTAGLVMVVEWPDDPPRGLLIVVTASAVTLMLLRGISPLWVVLIAIVLAMLGGRRGTVRLLRNRSLRLPVVVVVLAGVFSVVWIVAAGANNLRASSVSTKYGFGLLFDIWSFTGAWLHQMIGVFGWLDTPAPLLTYLIWCALTGLVTLVAFSCASVRGNAALAVLVALVIVVPIAVSYQEAHRLGAFWQGRYTLPLAAGVPIVATALIDDAQVLGAMRARLVTLMCIGVGLAQFAAYYAAYLRYAVGLPGAGGPINAGIINTSWSPPLGNVTMALWSLFVTAALVGFVAMAAHAATRGPADGGGAVAPPFLSHDRNIVSPAAGTLESPARWEP